MPKPNDSNGKGRAGVPGQKPTQAGARQRQRDAVELIVRGCRRDEVRKALMDKWGMSDTAADRWIRVAHDSILEISHQPLAQLIALSHETYNLVLKDPNASNRDKISAQKAIDELYGLPRAKKVALTTKEGDDVFRAVAASLSPEELAVAGVIGQRIEAAERGEKPLMIEGKSGE